MRWFLVFGLCARPSLGQADNYRMDFFENGTKVEGGFEGVELDVTLYAFGENGTTLQELELYNFNGDMSDVAFVNADYVEGSLTNRLDPPGAAPFTNGFLKPFEFREGRRVSLSSEIRFKIVLREAGVALLTCRAERFTLYDPRSGQRRGVKEKRFALTVTARASDATPVFVWLFVAIVVLAVCACVFFSCYTLTV